MDNEARDRLALEGYDPIYGARPLQRVIQKRILNPMAMEVINGSIKSGQVVEISKDFKIRIKNE